MPMHVAHVNPLVACADLLSPGISYFAPAGVNDAAMWIVCSCVFCLISVVTNSGWHLQGLSCFLKWQ